MKNLQRQFALLAFVLTSALACAQPLPKLNNMTPSVALASPSMITSITPVKQPCAHPIEPFDIDDYNGPTASRVGFSVANDMAWDVLREYWPEIARKFKLPFRTHN